MTRNVFSSEVLASCDTTFNTITHAGTPHEIAYVPAATATNSPEPKLETDQALSSITSQRLAVHMQDPSSTTLLPPGDRNSKRVKHFVSQSSARGEYGTSDARTPQEDGATCFETMLCTERIFPLFTVLERRKQLGSARKHVCTSHLRLELSKLHNAEDE